MAAGNKSTAELLRLILTAAMGGAMGAPGAGMAGGAVSGLMGGMGAPAPTAVDRFLANQYPNNFVPGKYHEYDVTFVDSDTPNMNAEGKANMGIIDQAGRMQSMKEHNDAIKKYVRMGMPEAQLRDALNRGMDAERNLPAFWQESKSRRPFTVSSSAVRGIRLTPDARIEVQWKGSDNWYTFKQYDNTYDASLAAQSLLKADSIGRAVMPYQRNGKQLKFKNPENNYSWFNRPNYDPSMA